MTDFYLKSGAGAADFQQAHTYSLGDKMVPARSDAGTNVTNARGWVWECTTAGLTIGSNPTWPSSVAQDVTTVTDGAATFTARRPGYSSGSTANWAYAAIYVDYVVTAMLAGDRLFVSKNDSQSYSTALTLAFPGIPGLPSLIYSVDDSAAPPTAVAAGASWKTTGNVNFNITGVVDMESMSLMAGSSTGTANLSISCTSGRLRNTTLVLGGTGSGSVINIANTIGAGTVYESPTFKFANTLQRIAIANAGGTIEIVGGGLDPASSAITALIQVTTGSTIVDMYGFDASAMAASGNIINQSSRGIDINLAFCKVPASWSGSPNGATPGEASRVTLDMCDSGATNYVMAVSDTSGTINQNTTVVMTGGATDGTTPLSWTLASNSQASYATAPLKSEWRSVWVDTTVSKTLTWNYVADTNVSAGQGAGTAFAFQNNQVWIEAMYMGSSASPLGTFASSAPSSPLATPSDNASGSASWTTTGLTTPKIGSCTLTFTTGMKGPMLARICVVAASKTIYADPAPTFA